MGLVTGERVVTAEGGFNPTWQRHVATYKLCAGLLPLDSPLLDLGCGVGHSFHFLQPRDTVGVDLDLSALRGQSRKTCVADMSRLPFRSGCFGSVLSVQSIEHVPDAKRVLAEVVRILRPRGTAIFVTPNRLTFARPHEIIDPYHFREYDPFELREVFKEFFVQVQILGLFGSTLFNELWTEQVNTLNRILRCDPLRLRRFIPRTLRQLLYDWQLTYQRRSTHNDWRHGAVTAADFHIQHDDLERSFDLIAICETA